MSFFINYFQFYLFNTELDFFFPINIFCCERAQNSHKLHAKKMDITI